MKVFQLKTCCHKLSTQTHVLNIWSPIPAIEMYPIKKMKRYSKSLLEMSSDDLKVICKNKKR